MKGQVQARHVRHSVQNLDIGGIGFTKPHELVVFGRWGASGQVRQSPEERLEALQEFYPDAQMSDWTLEIAGQRVQVIKKHPEKGGILEFGTEIVHAADGSIAALLGASPGASTSVSAMLDVLKKCFPDLIKTQAWQSTLKDLIPSYGLKLADDKELCDFVRTWTSNSLNLID